MTTKAVETMMATLDVMVDVLLNYEVSKLNGERTQIVLGIIHPLLPGCYIYVPTY